MAVTRTSTGSLVSSAAALTATFGAGATAGDLGILIVESANQTVTTPSGWTKIDGFGVGSAGLAGGTALWAFSKVSITSGDISSGISVADSGDHQNAVLLTFTGYDATTPWVKTFFGTDSSTSATTVNINGATGTTTTITANDVALGIICTDRDSATVSTNGSAAWANIAGSNAFIVNVSSATGAGGGIIVNQLTPSGTQTADASFSCTITASANASLVVVIKAPSGTVALTGQSLTNAIGSVLAATALALSGGALTGSQGSVAPQVAPALTSQSATAARGSVSPNVTVALTGLSLSAAQGTVVGGSVVTGQSTSVAQGSVTQSVSVALTGQALTAAQGSVAPSNTKALSGQSLAGAQGTVLPANSESLSGQAVVVARGTITPTNAPSLTGQALVVSSGTVTVSSSDVTAALIGQSLTAAQGSLAQTISAAMSGQLLSAAQGTVTPMMSLVLSGQSAASASGSLLAAVSLTLSGQSLVGALGNVTVLSSDVTVALTGQSIGLSLGVLFGMGVNGPPQLQDIAVGAENIVNKAAPAAGTLSSITEPSGQIVNHPPYPAA